MRKNSFWFALFIWMTLLVGGAAAPREVSLLFVCYDAGETYAFLPVMQRCQEAHIDYAVVVMATARDVAAKEALPRGVLLDLNEDLQVAPYVGKDWSWTRALSDKALAPIVQQLRPKVVVTGVVSKIEAQLAALFHQQGGLVFGYYDNPYQLLDAGPSRDVIPDFWPNVQAIMVPSQPIAEHAKGPVIVVGQPTFETWRANMEKVNVSTLRERLGFSMRQSVMTFCGGYGSEYEAAFKLFLEGLKTTPHYGVIVQIHPKANGDFEQKLIDEAKLTQCRVIRDGMTAVQAVAVADLVVVHRSTVGIQALFAGKPVVYVELPDAQFSNFAIEAGAAQQVTDPKQFAAAVQKERSRPIDIPSLYQRAGIPRNATELIFTTVSKPLKK